MVLRQTAHPLANSKPLCQHRFAAYETSKQDDQAGAHRRRIAGRYSPIKSCALIQHQRIKTTLAKAKAVRPLAERMVTLGKNGSIHARRTALAVLRQKSAVKKLFDNIAQRSAERNGGYTRIVKLGARKSDSARMAFIEWVDTEQVVEEKPTKEKKAKRKEPEPKPQQKTPEAEQSERKQPKAEAPPLLKKKKPRRHRSRNRSRRSDAGSAGNPTRAKTSLNCTAVKPAVFVSFSRTPKALRQRCGSCRSCACALGNTDHLSRSSSVSARDEFRRPFPIHNCACHRDV